MKKFTLALIILISICCSLLACGMQGEIDVSQTKDYTGAQEKLNIKTIFQLAKKKDSLTLNDFTRYTNGKKSIDQSGLNELITYEVDFRGIKYKLQVSYAKEGKSLNSVVLVYAANNDNIDIRNNSVEDFLNSHMSMSSYLTYELPDTLTNDSYNPNLGSIGGNLFLFKKTGSPEAIETDTDSTPYGWNSYGGVEMYYQLKNTFSNGKFTDISIPWNHSEYLAKVEPIDGCEVSALIVPVEHDLYTASQKPIAKKQSSKMWYVFFAKKDSKISYAIFLNADYFSKEDTISLAKSVKFKEGAFDIEIQ